ncbi:YdcF family protein [Sphingomonas donggukensis]|uniref:YdcF family protein n=1 Tax=Sphingomonas donggukensis TaxID=2949093 RepID=A0ABY4TYS6_9SPHN|nr:YdcF family protein [Sphingomonas donggukensis]URW77035.1 YdcF family protein [Sphingomonas donggukensis]
MLSLKGIPDARRTDAIVVLTGGAGRIPHGLALLEDKAAKRMLISGADPSVRPSELAAAYKVPRRLFTCCIDLGKEAVDTRSNGEETAAWVRSHKYTSVRLVTAEWHMPRARLELTKALGDGVEVIGDPVPSNPAFGMLVREYNKYLVRRAAFLVGYA